MKNKSTSNSEIINACKEIFKEKGLNSLNMREVASRCNVALGSIYNYYPSKSMLLLDTIDSIWKEILHKFNFEGNRFDEKVRDLFCLIQEGSESYPDFFNVHVYILPKMEKVRGRAAMEKYFQNIKNKLLDCLNQDKEVNLVFFNEEMTKEQFVEFVFDNLINLLLRKQDNCDGLLYVICRCIY